MMDLEYKKILKGVVQMSFIVTFSGLDGVGKSTKCNNVKEYLCKEYSLKGINTQDLIGNTFHSRDDLEKTFNKLKEYDVIVTRQYLSSIRMRQLKEQLFQDSSFKDTPLIRTIIQEVVENARLYFDIVIKRLLDMDNKIIIFDRFFYDEIAYRSLYEIPKHEIEEKFQYYPKEITKILLTAPVDIIYDRNKTREDSGTSLYKNKYKVQELVENFDYIAEKYNMTKISTVENENVVNSTVIKKIEEINDCSFCKIIK